MTSSALTLDAVLDTLEAHYDPPRTFLHWRTPLDLVVATILSAQCTDKRVNEVVQDLYKKYETAEDYVQVPREELEADIHSCGTYRMKAKHIQELCQTLLEEHEGNVPRTLEELTALPGIGRKTAAIILYAAFDQNIAVAVDTHVRRVARRLGLTEHKDPDKISLDLEKQVPQERWGRVTTLLISHGRAVCTARSRKCEECVFQETCPSSKVKDREDLASD